MFVQKSVLYSPLPLPSYKGHETILQPSERKQKWKIWLQTSGLIERKTHKRTQTILSGICTKTGAFVSYHTTFKCEFQMMLTVITVKPKYFMHVPCCYAVHIHSYCIWCLHI